MNLHLPSPYGPSPYASPFAPVHGIHPIANIDREKSSNISDSTLPTYINYTADLGGCGHWRIIWPANHLNITGKANNITLNRMVFDKNWYRGVKCVRVQRQADCHQLDFIKFLKSIQKECGFKIIYEIDDVIFREDIPDYNIFKHAFDDDRIRQNAIDIINLCDEVTVTCEYMKELYIEKTGKKEVTVIPNFPPSSWIGVHYNNKRVYRAFDDNKSKPRILYAGSGAHYDVKNKNGGKDDFSDILKYVIDTVDEFQWVFIGAFPPSLQEYVKSGKIEFHKWANLQEYPKLLANLNVQLMIAPLMNNKFNKSKSDIKFIEAALLGIPCLCQNLCTYSSVPDDLKFDDVTEFDIKIRSILNYKNRKSYYKNVDILRSIGEKRLLDRPENIGCHMEICNTPYGSRDRKYLAKWN